MIRKNQTGLSELDVYALYDSMERENIMLSFKGPLSEELIHSILEVVEHRLEGLEADSKTKKRVYHVLVECLHNLYHHGKNGDVEEEAIIVMVVGNEDTYSVITGNVVDTKDVEGLIERLNKVNQMSPEGLKELYRKVLSNGEYSEKGGGGLGIIDIARKSGEKLDYGVIPIDEFNTFFSLNVKIPN